MQPYDIKSEYKKPAGRGAQGWVIFLSIFLVVGLIFTIFGFSLGRTVFHEDFYIQKFEEQGFYAGLPVAISQVIISELSAGETASQYAWLSQEQISKFIIAVLPPDWLRQQTGNLLRSFFSFLSLEQEYLSVMIDTMPVKQNLTGPVGKQALLDILSGLPECTTEQILLIGLAIETGQTDFELCNPPESVLPFLDFVLDPILADVADEIPAVIQIPTQGQTSALYSLANWPVIRVLAQLHKLMVFIPWLTILAVLVLIIVSFKSLRLMMSGLGFSFIFSGLAGMVPGGMLYIFGGRAITGSLSSYLLVLPEGLWDPFRGVLQEIILSTGQGLLTMGLISLLLGLIFLGVKMTAKQ